MQLPLLSGFLVLSPYSSLLPPEIIEYMARDRPVFHVARLLAAARVHTHIFMLLFIGDGDCIEHSGPGSSRTRTWLPRLEDNSSVPATRQTL